MIEATVRLAQWCAAIVETIGILLITLSAVYCLIWGVVQKIKVRDPDESIVIWQSIRQLLGRGILLGLEYLIAADIIHTVAVEFSLESVGVLAIIVLIRTFLSFTLAVEIDGHWPWQRKHK